MRLKCPTIFRQGGSGRVRSDRSESGSGLSIPTNAATEWCGRPSSAARTFGRMTDESFGQPRLAALYDPLDPDRSDLDAYVRMAEEFRARRVLEHVHHLFSETESDSAPLLARLRHVLRGSWLKLPH